MSSNKLGWLKVKPITDRELIRRCYHAFVVGPSLCVPTIHSTDRGLARKREVLRARGLTERTCAHFLSTTSICADCDLAKTCKPKSCNWKGPRAYCNKPRGASEMAGAQQTSPTVLDLPSALLEIIVADLSASGFHRFARVCHTFSAAAANARQDAAAAEIVRRAVVDWRRVGDAACAVVPNVELPNGMPKIACDAFRYCHSLLSITIPASVTAVCNYSFLDCKKLVSVVLHIGVTHIGDAAFSRCASLISIELPAGLKVLGSKCFTGCVKLDTISIPDGITEISDATFSNCVALQSITLPPSLRRIRRAAFAKCSSLFLAAGQLRLEGPRLTIDDFDFGPRRLTIDDFAFHECSSLPPSTQIRIAMLGHTPTGPFRIPEFDYW